MDKLLNDLEKERNKIKKELGKINGVNFIEFSEIVKEEQIKSNCYEVNVYSGIYNGVKISIKEFSLMKVFNTLLDDFLHEVETALQTIHERIPKLHGVVFEKYHIWLIYDLIKGNNLKKLCEGKSLKEKVGYLMQVSKIVKDLHERKVFHKGLRSNKFILDKENIVFLKDLGPTDYEKGSYPSLKNENDPTGYLPPEFFEQDEGDYGDEEQEEKEKENSENKEDLLLKSKFDVWSMGCIISEIISGISPWSNYQKPNSTKKSHQINALNLLMQKNEFPIPEELPKEISNLLKYSMKINPEERICSEEVYERLEKYYNALE